MAHHEDAAGALASFAAIDRHFAAFLAGLSPGSGTGLLLAAALVSRAAAAGDVCLDLAAAAGRRLQEDDGGQSRFRCPPLEGWLQELSASPAVGSPGQRRPLILDAGHRLYLYRYWRYEQTLIGAIRERSLRPIDPQALAALKRAAVSVFDAGFRGAQPSQKLAAATAVLRAFCVITGGPGTGKTFTVAGILDLLAAMRPERSGRVLLAAPTGKAAARMTESLQRARRQAAKPPPAAATLHRLLGALPGSAAFRHHRGNPLPADLVIVDEASMVDLALMARLADALAPSAGLVLIGDPDQLASVEAGAVLGDICNRGRRSGFSTGAAAALSGVVGFEVPATPGPAAAVRDGIVTLESSYRFGPQSAISAASRAVREGDPRAATEILAAAGAGADVRWIDPEETPAAFGVLEKIILAGYESSFRAPTPEEALKRQADFRILCAHRSGRLGAEEVNRRAEVLFLKNGLIRPGDRRFFPWYAGRPVLIGRNDYLLELFNGDMGVCWRDPAGAGGEPSVYFADPRGGTRVLAPYRLPEHETVYAMTVHKSQGSEFGHVLVVLPERDSALLSRELLYTALTRARERVTLFARRAVLEAAVARRVRRVSGLREALWEA
jgi:exodeoxyribonuclease V alpha subunit